MVRCTYTQLLLSPHSAASADIRDSPFSLISTVCSVRVSTADSVLSVLVVWVSVAVADLIGVVDLMVLFFFFIPFCLPAAFSSRSFSSSSTVLNFLVTYRFRGLARRSSTSWFFGAANSR